jgi:hypothetical protein
LQGWYQDEFVFDGNRWRIEHRRAYVAEPESMGTGKVGEYFREFSLAVAKYRVK